MAGLEGAHCTNQDTLTGGWIAEATYLIKGPAVPVEKDLEASLHHAPRLSLAHSWLLFVRITEQGLWLGGQHIQLRTVL